MYFISGHGIGCHQYADIATYISLNIDDLKDSGLVKPWGAASHCEQMGRDSIDGIFLCPYE